MRLSIILKGLHKVTVRRSQNTPQNGVRHMNTVVVMCIFAA